MPAGAQLIAAAATASGHDYTAAGKPQIAWDDAAARAALVDGLVRDAHAVLEAIAATDPPPEGAAADAVGLLALVAGQDVEYVPDPDDPGGGGRWQIAQRVAKDRVISTVDPDTRHAHKTVHRRQDGFKAHLVAEPDTGLITGCALTRASGDGSGDAAAGLALLAADPTIERARPASGSGSGAALEVLGDSAYGTGAMLAALADAGHVAMIKPWPVHSLIPGGLTAADFAVDEAAGMVTCPAGKTVAFTAGKRVAKFKDRCAGCPLRTRCTTSAAGRTVLLAEHDALQRAHRTRAADPEFQAIYRRHRPMIERTIAWLTRGNRRLRYRGVTKNDAWLHLRVAAINLRRLLTLGLTGTPDHWALAS